MTSGQPAFIYTDSQLETIVKYVSIERLRMYITSIRDAKGPGDRLQRAIKMYEKNTAYSEAMYTVMQGFEVTFRNAIHNRLSADYDTPWWFDTVVLQSDEKDSIALAKKTIENKPQRITPDRVVGELNFGFWVKLFSGNYADTLWGPSLKHIFPASSERGRVYSRFKDLKTIRNRIAHHNRIIGRPITVRQSYDMCLEAIGWLDPTIREWVAATNNVPLRLGKPLVERTAR